MEAAIDETKVQKTKKRRLPLQQQIVLSDDEEEDQPLMPVRAAPAGVRQKSRNSPCAARPNPNPNRVTRTLLARYSHATRTPLARHSHATRTLRTLLAPSPPL